MDLGGFAEMSFRTWVPTGSRVIVYAVKIEATQYTRHSREVSDAVVYDA